MTPSDPWPVLQLLRAHLEGRLRQGEKRLWLQPGAAAALREIVRSRPRPWPRDFNPAGPESPPTVLKDEAESDVRKEAGFVLDPPVPDLPTLQSKPLREALTHAEKDAALAEIRNRVMDSTEVKALGTLRDTMVFSTGTPMADIVFIGEAPGVEEERQAEPFVGPAGQLLTKILKVMGLERDQVYITNICKYRPAMENQGSGNRKPTATEMESCLGFVREELEVVRPKVIVALGGTALVGLLGIQTGIMHARGKFYEFNGIPVMATLHPSYLLRMEAEGPVAATAAKRKVWEDMLMVMERAGLPINDKQRNYFLTK